MSSQSIPQLQGTDVPASTLETACIPLVKEGNMTLNPCGLIANTFFTGKVPNFVLLTHETMMVL